MCQSLDLFKVYRKLPPPVGVIYSNENLSIRYIIEKINLKVALQSTGRCLTVAATIIFCFTGNFILILNRGSPADCQNLITIFIKISHMANRKYCHTIFLFVYHQSVKQYPP